MRFKRPCRRCGEMFRPTGRDCRLCQKCFKERIKAGTIKQIKTWEQKRIRNNYSKN